MVQLYQGFNSNTAVLITLSLLLFSGFLLTRFTKLLRLPNVSGYIIAGVLLSPHVLNLVPAELIAHMGFLSDIALSFIAFSVGKYFLRDVIRSTGLKVIRITLWESLAAGAAITLAMHFLFQMEWDFSLLLGAIATATAPASTIMTIQQYHAKGEFVNVLLQVVALDDVVCLLVFSAAAALLSGNKTGSFSISSMMLPILYNLGALVLGVLCALLLSRLLSPKRSRDNRLILAVAMLLGIAGICAAFDTSPLLACMLFSAVYANKTGDTSLYLQLDNFTPPILSLFFVVSGLNLDLTTLTVVGVAGVAYFIIRILAKYLGAYLGCMNKDTSSGVRTYLGFALVPQAGVAIGLAFLGQRILPTQEGNLLLTIILSSSVLYELIGPACATFALFRSGAISKEPSS